MWNFSLIFSIIAVSTSLIVADEGVQCRGSFHNICGFSDVIIFVNQTNCSYKTSSEDFGSKYFCQKYVEPHLTLNLQDFSAIAPYAFNTTNFTVLRFISKSENCDPKVIDSIPESFNGLSSVRDLTLDCVKFSSTPDLFKELVSVDKLTISRMELKNVEDFLSIFPKLRILTGKKVNITAITKTFSSKINPGLQQLFLVSGNLTMIESESLEKFHNLTILEIKDNHISDLQHDVFNGLHALKFLNLAGNAISVLRKNTFSELLQLEILNLSKNKISEIEVGTFGGLPIRIIDLSYNGLKDLPVGVLKNLPNLTVLSLKVNKIRILRMNVFEGLGEMVHLNLEHNNIHNIESNAFRCLYLYSLNLSHNELNVLEPDTFNSLHVEADVDLSCNKIIKIKEQAFRNLTTKEIILPFDITEIPRYSWGVDSKEKIRMNFHRC